MNRRRRGVIPRAAAAFVALSMLGPIFGCGRQNDTLRASPPNAPYGSVPPSQRQSPGLSTKQKLALLAGAAAVYYLYQKNKNKTGAGPNGKYYRSKNGRVYYRDAKGNAVWVTPPPGGIQVPAEEAARYERAARQENFTVGGPPGPAGRF